MIARFLVVVSLVAGFALPVAAGERVQWIDPWAVDELAGGAADDGVAADGRIDITGELQTFGFAGGVERHFAFAGGPVFFGRSLPAGQRPVTGESVRMVRPQPRF